MRERKVEKDNKLARENKLVEKSRAVSKGAKEGTQTNERSERRRNKK